MRSTMGAICAVTLAVFWKVLLAPTIPASIASLRAATVRARRATSASGQVECRSVPTSSAQCPRAHTASVSEGDRVTMRGAASDGRADRVKTPSKPAVTSGATALPGQGW